MIERKSTITSGEYAFVKIKKSKEESGSILLRCYKVSIEKKKDKIDVSEFPSQFKNYVYINKPEILLTFESYTENEYISESIKNLDEVVYFDIEVYKDENNVEIFENMILTSYKDLLDATDVEKFTLEFTKSSR